MDNFNMQGLTTTAWACAMAGQMDAARLAKLARAAEQCVGSLKALELQMTLWALSQHESLIDAQSLFDHAKRRACCEKVLAERGGVW